MEPKPKINWFGVLMLLAAGFLLLSDGGMPFVGPPAGPRYAIIVHETEDMTPERAMLMTALRAGPQAKALADKGHKLDILDDDSESPVLTPWKPFTPPELIVLAGDKLVSRQPLPATADAVVEAVR